MRWPIGALFFVLVLSIAGCAEKSRPPDVTARSKVVQPARQGLASYYGRAFDGNITASGVRFDMHSMVAAHPSLPFGTIVRVTNLKNGRSARAGALRIAALFSGKGNGALSSLAAAAGGGVTAISKAVIRIGRGCKKHQFAGCD